MVERDDQRWELLGNIENRESLSLDLGVIAVSSQVLKLTTDLLFLRKLRQSRDVL